jgi:hypothetical protein
MNASMRITVEELKKKRGGGTPGLKGAISKVADFTGERKERLDALDFACGNGSSEWPGK